MSLATLTADRVAFDKGAIMRHAHHEGRFALATEQVRHALAAANAMQDRDRRALCMRLLNWLRADASRHPARKAA